MRCLIEMRHDNNGWLPPSPSLPQPWDTKALNPQQGKRAIDNQSVGSQSPCTPAIALVPPRKVIGASWAPFHAGTNTTHAAWALSHAAPNVIALAWTAVHAGTNALGAAWASFHEAGNGYHALWKIFHASWKTFHASWKTFLSGPKTMLSG